ncbi:MAG: inositol monophosphatase [Rhodospirillales bacterium]|nr:inositol monophosphatase [Rhodospirillales bacterium]
MKNEDGIGVRFQTATEVIREAGAKGLHHFRNREGIEVMSKGVQDVVSNADRELEAFIRSSLETAFPGDAFFGEESGRGDGDLNNGIWVVDPIDGTDCFVNSIPVWCVSIAFLVGKEVEIGLIYDPNADELFAARRGHGATVNGVPIRASQATSFRDGLLSMGYSMRRPYRGTIDILERFLAEDAMFQRNGSGALALAYVAAGRYIAYYEAHINSWDCLAAIGLIREAGGWTNDFLDGDGLFSGNVIAASAPGLEGPMRRVCRLD